MRTSLVWLMGSALCLSTGASAPAAAPDETGESAVWLLKKSMLIHQDGRHNVLLRAMRQMRDPKLQPLLAELVQKRHPVLKLHGILGLAEISSTRRIDLALVADLKDPLTQAQLVTSAIEADLLDIEQCKQLLDWPGLEAPVKLIVAGKLVSSGQLKDPAALDKLRQDSEKLAMRGMRSLLKLQLGDKAALRELQEIGTSQEPGRDDVRVMLLQTALRYELAGAGPWAMKVAQESQSAETLAFDEKSLAFLALRAALVFDAAGAADLWGQRFDQCTSPADRIRLALLGLDVAERVGAARLGRLIDDKDPVIQQMGRTGRAIASGQAVEEELMKLVEINHALSSQWVLAYADRVPMERARAMLVALILAAEGEPNPPLYRRQRIEQCVFATQKLVEKDSSSHALIGQILSDSPPLTQEAVLMGLIRSDLADAHKLIEGLTFKSDTGQAMALLLRARAGSELSDDDLRRLGLIVRGGAGLEEPLRLQAGWVYLKATRQESFALASILGK